MEVEHIIIACPKQIKLILDNTIEQTNCQIFKNVLLQEGLGNIDFVSN